MLYRLLEDKKNNSSFFEQLDYQNFVRLKESYHTNDKFIKNENSYIDRLYDSAKNKNLTFEENLFLQKTDYFSYTKMNMKISLGFLLSSLGLLYMTKKSLEFRKPFAFLDNNRLLYNRLYKLRTALSISLKFFSFCFSVLLLGNLFSLYVLKFIFNDEIEIEKSLKKKYADKYLFYELVMKQKLL